MPSDDTDDLQWPREIWARELDKFDPTGIYVLSPHAEFHRYVDGDILDSTERYYEAKLEAERERCARLDAALRAKESAMQELFRRLDAAGVDTSDLIP